MIRREVVFAPKASDDLLNLYEWIAARAGAAVAAKYIDRIEKFCSRFDLASERGQRRDDI